ncbi:YdeI/OmpD-associated family protein [Ferruginibacter paludis]|uniref:YdeI/OmpD-associated family protein n=1 Tax=Ferruginibacter paludis TaxID=1310417 RepID=UPI0025B6078C|nr:YdeI/OmpD-associated family protein [Ferruginibacter paludis]MDN3658830.1 YdeI/OmpD-associated family protein [Ferruginibacter paludis]
MAIKDNPIDIYVSKAADFAKPILNHLRALVHTACPDAEEKIKWGFPHFDYKGEMMCSMAAFKQHAVFGFWKAALMKDPVLIERAKSEVSMGHLGRLTSLKDLPPDRKIVAWINEAMQLNDQGIKVPSRPKTTDKKELIVPDYFLKALSKHKKAAQTFEAFSYSHKKEYVQWIEEAKTDETKNKRMAQAIEMMKEGKSRNWKYATK